MTTATRYPRLAHPIPDYQTPIVFDADDVGPLVALGVPHLRREIHAAELRLFLQQTFIDTPYQNDRDSWPWNDWLSVCRLALTIARSLELSSLPKMAHGRFKVRVDVESLKTSVDIATVAGRYATLTKYGRSLKGLCPFHSEKQASFFVYPERRSWHCFGACGTGGDVISFIMRAENTDFRGALAILERL